MPVAAGVAVAGWLGATGVTAAIVVGAVSGAITGGLIGAASSLISGGDIIEGTLKGALIGGVTGGVLNGAMEGISEGSSLGAKEVAENAAAKEFLTQSPNATLSEAAQYGKDYVATPIGGSAGGKPPPGLLAGGGQNSYNVPAAPNPQAEIDALTKQRALDLAAANKESMKTAAVLGGVTGVGQGAVQLFGNKAAAEARTEEADRLAAIKNSQLAGNQAGTLQARLARFKLPEKWTTAVASPLAGYQKPIQPGLLAGGVI